MVTGLMIPTIRVTVKTVPHPEPERLVDVWAQLVLKEIRSKESVEQKEATTQ